MQIRVRVAAQPRPVRTLGAAQHAFGDRGDDVEVGPPQRHGHGQAEHDRGHQRTRHRFLRRADTERHDRLPEGDDHDQAVPFGEVGRGLESPALGAAEVDARVVGDQGSCPHSQLSRTVEEAASDEQHGPDRDRDGDPEELVTKLAVLTTRRGCRRTPR